MQLAGQMDQNATWEAQSDACSVLLELCPAEFIIDTHVSGWEGNPPHDVRSVSIERIPPLALESAGKETGPKDSSRQDFQFV